MSSGISPGAKPLLLSGYPPFCDRRRIDFCDLAQAVGFGRMRARDEGSADFGRVPAGLHAEAKRFFRHDMAWREVLHQVLSVLRRSIWSGRLDEVCSSLKAGRRLVHVSSAESRVRSASTAATRSR